MAKRSTVAPMRTLEDAIDYFERCQIEQDRWMDRMQRRIEALETTVDAITKTIGVKVRKS